tara:strand:+ start:30002 stop:31156 length:1155 start_codon:yes stop_codon:yes gene_type:complete
MLTKPLHIITSLSIGGAETMLLRLIKHKPDLVKSTIVISLTDNGEIGRILESMGVSVISLGMHNWSSIFKALFKLKKIIQNEKPDIIHTWMYHANILGGIAAFLAKNKNIIWSIRRSEFTRGESLSTYIVMRIGAMFSNVIPKVIVCVAESGLKNHQNYGYKSDSMIVIPNGFDLEHLKHDPVVRKEIRKELNIYDDEVVIGCVGRFHESKGYEILIASSVEVIKLNEKVRYLLIGRDLDQQNTILMEWINKTGFSDHFLLAGEKHNVADYMSAMDIYCLSSITEGFPNVVGEAMASALPCVVTSVGDVQKITGNNAILVQPKNKKLLSKGLCEILNMDNEKRYRMGLRGRIKIEEEYPIKLICEKYYNLYSLISCGENNYEKI